ncbi:serine/threonine-protein kinase [Streptomyces sp. 7N604]|uniref:serine/threonine-protein kinase n=1 Tax=Streptomyces sp. 7N604 TaxID=3457415 RepID=UPI003FD55C5B
MLTAGRYRFVELLGRGAMGEVWRAQDTTLGRDVAVKLLLEHTAVADAAERFRREAQTAAQLNHPNVVAVYDFGEEAGRGYLVMELVPGRSLRQEMADRGPFRVEEARHIAGQAATGLAAAHARGVVHRDIKPGNLLLTGDTIKVADFGIARAAVAAASALTTTGEVLGTSSYLAPERGMGGAAGPESDVYALGCVLYEMLCGHPPFSGDPAAVVYQHVNAAPQPPAELRPDIPAALADFTLRMLAKDAAARPTATQAAQFLAEDSAATGIPGALRSTAQEAGTSRSTLPLVPGPGQGSRRRPVPVIAAMVAVFLAACVVGFQLNSGSDDEAHTPSPTESQSRTHQQGDPATTPPPAKDELVSPEEARKAAEEERERQEEAAKEAEEEERKRQEEAVMKEAEEQKKQ